LLFLKIQKKNYLFDLNTRIKQIKLVTKEIKNVKIIEFDGLLSELLKEENPIIVKGLRNEKDFLYEQEMEYFNKLLNKDFESIFLMARDKFKYISSSNVKIVAGFCGDLGNLVPKEIEINLKEKFEKITKDTRRLE